LIASFKSSQFCLSRASVRFPSCPNLNAMTINLNDKFSFPSHSLLLFSRRPSMRSEVGVGFSCNDDDDDTQHLRKHFEVGGGESHTGSRFLPYTTLQRSLHAAYDKKFLVRRREATSLKSKSLHVCRYVH
jgi:hypothetical protein